MITLETPRIIQTRTHYYNGEWYLIVKYNDGEDDEYGPFDSEQEAKNCIF
jgi:hypothetical protein